MRIGGLCVTCDGTECHKYARGGGSTFTFRFDMAREKEVLEVGGAMIGNDHPVNINIVSLMVL